MRKCQHRKFRSISLNPDGKGAYILHCLSCTLKTNTPRATLSECYLRRREDFRDAEAERAARERKEKEARVK